VINNKKTQLSVCIKCAEEKGLTNPLAGLPDIFGKIVANILGEHLLSEADEAPKKSNSRRCPKCNISLDKFEKTGLLGCEECYQTFEKELAALLRRIHGSSKHIGSRPRPRRVISSERDVVKLRAELEQAIGKEKFERAAELRDLIRDAEREAGSRNSGRNRKA
jgi:protein arginine kinase activator